MTRIEELTTKEVAAGLTRGTVGAGPFESAAVLALVVDERWLDRPEFRAACLLKETTGGSVVIVVSWHMVWDVLAGAEARRGTAPADPDVVMLRFVHTLATDGLNLCRLNMNRAAIVVGALREALAASATGGHAAPSG